MLPLKFCEMCFDSHMIHRFVPSGDKAFRTFDWEIPNCRAIREGVTPALNAARTNSVDQESKGLPLRSHCRRFSVVADCGFVKSGPAYETASRPCGILPRRFISSSVAAYIKSNSPSLKCLTALRRFLGRTCRCDAISVAASVPGNFGGAGLSPTAAAENRLGVRSVGLRPMALACREEGRSAISSERPVHTLQHSQTFRAPHAPSLWWVARPCQKASTPSSGGFEGVSICSRTRLFTVLICVKDGSSHGQ